MPASFVLTTSESCHKMRTNPGLVQNPIDEFFDRLSQTHGRQNHPQILTHYHHGGIVVPAKKIVCLGGGSLYFRRAIPDLLLSQDLGGSELVLYDIDKEKVERIAAMGRRLAEVAGTEFKIRSTIDLADAVDGADFAISSIGGSGSEITRNVYNSYFHNADIRIPEKYDISQVIGDTCGPAGMMMALRSIPAYISICREMEKRCSRRLSCLITQTPWQPYCARCTSIPM